MGYINSNTGYPSHTLSTRSVIKKNMYAVITPDGLVKNNIYGYENCDISILSSPLLGASFVDYIITVKKEGRNISGIGQNGEEVFLFVIEGMYNLNNNWYGVEKDDYIFMVSYCIQGGYCVGKDDFIYIYSKDCNRDAEIE